MNDTQSHYCLITNLAGLCRAQVTANCTQRYICRRCLHFCKSERTLDLHLEKCSKHNAQKTVFPKKNDEKGKDKVRFTKIEKQLPLPFYFVADFECILEKMATCAPSPSKSSTTVTHNHIPCGAAYKISCTDPRFYKEPEIFLPDGSNKSIAERFLDSIQHDSRELRKMLSYKVPMLPLTDDEQARFDAGTTCYLCDGEIKPDEKKCKDHDHLTGAYGGLTHNRCNLQYRIKPKTVQIPCFFHNLKNYDAHLLIAAAKERHGRITCVPTTTEKYISFTIGGVVFKDSYAFTQAGLDELVTNLGKDQLGNTQRWLESKLTTKHHRNRDALQNSSDSDTDYDDEDDYVMSTESESEQPSEYDQMFVDDRPVAELETVDDGDDDDDDGQCLAGPSGWKRGRVVDDGHEGDDEHGDDDDDEITLEPPRRRVRQQLMTSDDDDDDDSFDTTQHDSNGNEDTMCEGGESAHVGDEGDLVWDGSDEEGSGDGDDADVDDDRLYVKEMHECDYRWNPYIPPTLSRKGKKLVKEDLEMLSTKGVYPYEYMDSFDKFKERAIPNKIDAFYSSLTGETITEEQHQHAQNVFKHFGMETLQEYHNLYLLQDVFLLDDVLTAFRNMCIECYGLDPWHYYTAPGLTWDAGLKYTGATLDLLTDEKQFLFVEEGLRGGVSMISHRYAKANDPTLGEDEYFNADEPKRQLLYLDANNLYGWAMSQYLPISNFEWMSEECVRAITASWIESLTPDGDMGYILEVDLAYPKEVHSKHADYPLAPERRKVTGTMLSPYQRKILRAQYMVDNPDMSDADVETKIDAYESCDKLIPNLQDKKRYILHYRNLQLYLSLGMKLTKVHQVLCFKQSAWLKPYIDHNTDKRKAADNEFEKNFFKLMNNAMFGKTMENVRKRRTINIVTETKQMKKLIAQPTFKSITIFNPELSAIERTKALIMMDKPIYVGMCVLDLSKWLMYDFFYNRLKKMFPKSQLLFTDTDSLCVSVEGDDAYQRMQETDDLGDGAGVAADLFDFSNYHKDHFCSSSKNKKVPGKMKDELGGNAMLEFIGLRAKAYGYRERILWPSKDDKDPKVGDLVEIKKLKGINKSTVKNTIHFDQYKSCLHKGRKHLASMTSLRSYLHQVKTLQSNKIALTHFDDKRYLWDDGITSYPFGHYAITSSSSSSTMEAF